MSVYKIEPRSCPGWRHHDTATLGVSVPSPNWSGEKLATILAFAGTHFHKVRIDVTDALYRHDFMAKGATETLARTQADALGALWLATHHDLIADLVPHAQIIRWGTWYKHPDFERTLARFHSAFENDLILRNAVMEDIHNFFQRTERSASLRDKEGCKDFLIEELAVLTLQARELPSVRIYPGTELKCLAAVRACTTDTPKGLEQELFMRIKFEKRAAPSIPIQACG